MIEITDLTKSFHGNEVLKNINITIPKGMIYGLIGRSGAGKSTLLRCINGLERYDGGSLTVNGAEVKQFSERELREFRKNIGMIFQQFSLLERMTVYENVALPLQCWKYDKQVIDRKVKELLHLVGISEKINSLPRELSGGQKQRVAIARALTMDPQILLCDEATSALDPKTAKSITGLLNQINRELGITIIIVTHQMSVLRAACEEIAILEDGMIAVQGAVEQIFLQQPQALKNLIGEADMVLPSTGTNVKILLSHEHSDQPIITQMARDVGTDFIILGGEMEQFREKILGSVIINVAEAQTIGQITDYLSSRGVGYEIIGERDDQVQVHSHQDRKEDVSYV